MPQRFQYFRPQTLHEAVGLLEEHGTEARLLSGGTDLMVGIRHGHLRPGVVIDLKGIPDLRPAIEEAEGEFTISANTVMTDLEEDERIARHFPALIEAARVVGSVQIRNRATLVGNISNASPAADTPPVLVALGASVVAWSTRGERTLPLDQFWLGYRQTALQPGELLTAVRIPLPRRPAGSAFLKLGRRRALEISIVCVGASIELAPDGAIAAAGLGLGSVAAYTVRASGAEKILVGARPDPEVLAAAGEAALTAATPIDDLRSKADYRRAMVPVLVSRAVAAAVTRAKQGDRQT
ncbi:MAG: xanthine dehydrogenase family protein subunit M [Gemmatimonadetes bacterium]|nr:xanthine dehydrogenase family protein subunit M [Gemmatimonadota bacterium]